MKPMRTGTCRISLFSGQRLMRPMFSDGSNTIASGPARLPLHAQPQAQEERVERTKSTPPCAARSIVLERMNENSASRLKLL